VVRFVGFVGAWPYLLLARITFHPYFFWWNGKEERYAKTLYQTPENSSIFSVAKTENSTSLI